MSAVLGFALGVAVVLLYQHEPKGSSGQRAARQDATNDLIRRIAGDETGSAPHTDVLRARNTGDRSLLVLLAARADTAELEKLVTEAGNLDDPQSREFALNTLLARYAELDPHAAIDLAYRLELGEAAIATVYASWAEVDAPAALAALHAVDDAGLARRIALEMFAALGGDGAARAAIENALPQAGARQRFHLDVLVRRAETEPREVFDEVLAMDALEQKRVLARIAPVWARVDPVAALAASHLIDDQDARWRLQRGVLDEWATEDPDAMFDYVAGIAGMSPEASQIVGPALWWLVPRDPVRAMRVAETLPDHRRIRIMNEAIGELSKTDPEMTLALIRDLSGGIDEKSDLYVQFARTYARSDPDAALAWMATKEARSSGATGAVLAVISETEPERALSYALTLESRQERYEALERMARAAVHSSGGPERIANLMLRIDDRVSSRSAMTMLAYAWGESDPESAVDWFASNLEKVGAQNLRALGENIARSDPAAAEALIARVPESVRRDWVKIVAAGYANSDTDKALVWIRRFQGQPEYDHALAGISEAVARRQPETLLSLLGGVEDQGSAVKIARVAVESWAMDDPVAAASWARGQSNELVRATATFVAVQQWAHRDRVGAERWVLQLEPGFERDDALLAVIYGGYTNAPPDRSLWDEFSNDTTRQDGALQIAMAISRTDPIAARRLIDEQVTDPALRRRAEGWLALR